MDSPEAAALELRTVLTDCFEQMRYAHATELARSKRYLEAEAILSPQGRIPAAPKVLDLLARISAQQGQYDRARQFWSTALEITPGNADYERAIQCTREAEISQAAWQRSIAIAVAALLLGSSSVSAWMYFRDASNHTQSPLKPKVSVTVKPTPAQPDKVPAKALAKPELAPTE